MVPSVRGQGIDQIAEFSAGFFKAGRIGVGNVIGRYAQIGVRSINPGQSNVQRHFCNPYNGFEASLGLLAGVACCLIEVNQAAGVNTKRHLFIQGFLNVATQYRPVLILTVVVGFVPVQLLLQRTNEDPESGVTVRITGVFSR